MSGIGVLRIVVYLAVLFLLVKPLGAYMARVLEGKRTFFDPVLRPLERLLYRICGVSPEEDMSWQAYSVALLLFSVAGMLLLYAFQRLQAVLPLNPQAFSAVPYDLSFNTAASFTTNTNWQAYGGESTLSYFVQMAGLTVKNFASAAAGLAVLVALIRGLARGSIQALGNFWVDLVRSSLYIFLPLSVVLALLLVSQGVVQTLSSYKTATLVEPTSYEQPITDANGKPVLDAQGPAEDQDDQGDRAGRSPSARWPRRSRSSSLARTAADSSTPTRPHPFENPTPFSNFLEMLAITLIPVGARATRLARWSATRGRDGRCSRR